MVEADCRAEQILELEWLAAIYNSGELNIINTHPVCLGVSLRLEDVNCQIELANFMPTLYPLKQRLRIGCYIQCSPSFATRQQQKQLVAGIDRVCEELGEVVIYSAIQIATAWMEDRHNELQQKLSADGDGVKQNGAIPYSVPSGSSATWTTNTFIYSLYHSICKEAKVSVTVCGDHEIDKKQQEMINQFMDQRRLRTRSSAKLGLRSNLWDLANQEELAPSDSDDIKGPNLLRLNTDNDDELLDWNEVYPDYSRFENKETFCLICLENISLQHDAYALNQCHESHFACLDCWNNYLLSHINDGDPYLKCIGFKCNVPVHEEFILAILSWDTYQKYRKFLRSSYVDLGDWQWCPSGCDRATSVLPNNPGVCIPILCNCGMAYCCSCLSEQHFPAKCSHMEAYKKFIEGDFSGFKAPTVDDSKLTAHWVDTKECPKCKTQWEKMDGCNHIHCQKCHHHFCWECLLDWADNHDNFYKCSQKKTSFKKVKVMQETEDQKQAWIEHTTALTAQSHLQEKIAFHESYSHYFRELAKRSKSKLSPISKRIGSKVTVAFLKSAFNFLSDIHQLLKHSYIWLFAITVSQKIDSLDSKRQESSHGSESEDVTAKRRYLHHAEYLVQVLDQVFAEDLGSAFIVKRTAFQVEDTIKGIKRQIVYFSHSMVKRPIEKLKSVKIVPIQKAIMTVLRNSPNSFWSIDQLLQYPSFPPVHNLTSKRLWSAAQILLSQKRIRSSYAWRGSTYVTVYAYR